MVLRKMFMACSYETELVDFAISQYKDCIDEFYIFADQRPSIKESAIDYYESIKSDTVKVIKWNSLGGYVCAGTAIYRKYMNPGDIIVFNDTDSWLPKLKIDLKDFEDNGSWFGYGYWKLFVGDYKHVAMIDDTYCWFYEILRVPPGGFSRGCLLDFADSKGRLIWRHPYYSSNTTIMEGLHHYQGLVRPQFYYHHIRPNSNEDLTKKPMKIDNRYNNTNYPCDPRIALKVLSAKHDMEIFEYDLEEPPIAKLFPPVDHDIEWGPMEKWSESRFGNLSIPNFYIEFKGTEWSQPRCNMFTHDGYKGQMSKGFRKKGYFK